MNYSKTTTIEEHIAKVSDLLWHCDVVLREAKKTALKRLKDEVGYAGCEEIDGDLYKICECIKEGARHGEGYYLAKRYKADGELVDYYSQVKMHYEPRDTDPDEGDYEEWELVEEFYDGGK